MKALNYLEVAALGRALKQKLEGAQLQAVWSYDQGLVLELYKYDSYWLVLDISMVLPFVGLFEKAPSFSKKPKPAALYIHAHLKNLRLVDVDLKLPKERILILTLAGGPKEGEIQLDLIPRAANLSVRAAGKEIFWDKPKPVKEPSGFELPEQEVHWDLLGKSLEWLQWKSSPVKAERGPTTDSRPKKLLKLQKALGEIQQKLEQDPAEEFFNLGEALKWRQELSEAQKKLLDPKLSLRDNQERAFQKAKDLRQKKEGSLARLELLKVEIENIEKDIQENPIFKQPEIVKNNVTGLEKAQVRGRKKQIAEDLTMALGRSAEENLQLLRKSQAWDLWIHLKDFPSSYGILTRTRNRNVSREELIEAAQWLVKETVAKKQSLKNEKLSVVFAECRHVRPIKGDKMGRVTYQNAQQFVIAVGDD